MATRGWPLAEVFCLLSSGSAAARARARCRTVWAWIGSVRDARPGVHHGYARASGLPVDDAFA